MKLLIVFAVILTLWANSVRAKTFTVTTTSDDPTDDVCNAHCSLRDAVGAAQDHPGPDVVAIPAGVYALTEPLDVFGPETLLGAGRDATILEGAGPVVEFRGERALDDAGTLAGIAVRGGNTSLSPPGNDRGKAAGVHAVGGVTLRDCAVTDNIGFYGGVYVGGGATLIERCDVSVNKGVLGSGVYVEETDADFDAVLEIRDSRIAGNCGSGPAGGVYALAEEALILRSELSDNAGCEALPYAGGALLEGGPALVEDSRVLRNEGIDTGGLSFKAVFGTGVVVRRTAVEDNRGDGSACGLRFEGPAERYELTESLVANNVPIDGSAVEFGGAVFQEPLVGGSILVRNVTFSGNGPGVLAGGLGIAATRGPEPIPRSVYDVALENVTFVGNTTGPSSTIGSGASIWADYPLRASGVVVDDGPNACFLTDQCVSPKGPIMLSFGGNLDAGSSCGFDHPTDLVNTDPMLGPLQDNGGPTRTHALLPGSPAIDRGGDGVCPATDQRGEPRSDGKCDAGAYEARVRLICGAAEGAGSGTWLALAAIPPAALLLRRRRRAASPRV